MGRQEIIDHIEAELNQNTTSDFQKPPQPILCQFCGSEIASANSSMSEHGDYVVHRIPDQGSSQMRSVFYRGPSCFSEAMADLFSATDG